MRNKLAHLLISFGLICFIVTGLLLWQRNNPNRLAFEIGNLHANASSNQTSNNPTELVIGNLNIDLPIVPAQINNGKWEATTKGVSYLKSSALPGETGNSIIYGHNWSNLLGRLVEAKPNQQIIVRYDNGLVRYFKIKSTQVVSPSNTSILAASDDQRLTVYTCTGLFDSKRFVVVATLEDK